ncbi:MAG: glycogen/starch synthase [Cytophagales bacterium]|nr:glycogen/starch synthase [Cytophagales bacterium]
MASEVHPFLSRTKVAEFVRHLPEAMQERGLEIRILVPRFGLINERKNRLYEVVRLSGTNISIGDKEQPLAIKVASIPKASRMQVYFVDNPDYFKRKSTFFDERKNFYPDNGERTIFFCRGVLETIRKLGWAPDIIHCNDWMTSLVPVYVKTIYKKDPIFEHTKCVFSLHEELDNFRFQDLLIQEIFAKRIQKSTPEQKNNIAYDSRSLIQLGMEYADAIMGIKGEEFALHQLTDKLSCEEKKIDCVTQDDCTEEYYNLYHELVS